MEGRPLDDAELVERARGGDVDAYARLVERHQGIAHRVAYLVTRSAEEAEDAVQEAFVKAFYALGRFREGGSFRPWLLAIVRNEARNRSRSAGRRARLALRVAEDPASGDAAPSPEAAVLDRRRRELLIEGLERLKERDRLVIAYRYFLGLSHAEIAQLMECPEGTVLVWEEEGVTIRVESALPLEEVLSIAESMRPAETR